MIALGITAIWNMKIVQIESDKLSREYVPEVDIASELERTSLLSMYAIRGYTLTNDKTFLETGKKYLNEVAENIKAGTELAVRSPHLDKLKENIEKADIPVREYNALLEQTTHNLDELKLMQSKMNEAAAKFLEYSYGYLNNQSTKMKEDIESRTSPKMLQERYLKTTLINDVIDLGNATQIAAWKGMAQNDVTILHHAESNFIEMKKKLDEIRPMTTKEVDLKSLDAIEKSINDYEEANENYQVTFEKQQEIDKEREEAGDYVLSASDEIAHKGIDQTIEIATQASSSLAKSLWIMIIGLIIATAMGILMAFTVTTAISRPLKIAIDGIRKATNQVGSASEQLSSAAQQLSSGANDQASAIEETSASLEEMLGMVQNNVVNAKKANELSTEVKTISEEGNTAMTKLQRAMEEILSSNEKIEQLVKVIGEIGEKTKVMDEIVFQTKLLSFNASVEAERAGEHGRGFAVVAQEVGNLAQMSGKSAQEISQILSESIKKAEAITTENKKKVEIGNGYVLESSKILSAISASATQVVAGASQVSSASEEQATGIRQISTAMTNLDRAVQENAATAEETASTSEELSGQAESLQNLVQSLVTLMEGNRAATYSPPSSQIQPISQKYSQASTNRKNQKNGQLISIYSDREVSPKSKTGPYKMAAGSDYHDQNSSEAGWEEL